MMVVDALSEELREILPLGCWELHGGEALGMRPVDESHRRPMVTEQLHRKLAAHVERRGSLSIHRPRCAWALVGRERYIP